MESLAVAQFTRRGGHPLQRRLAETNFCLRGSEGIARLFPALQKLPKLVR